MKFLSSLAHLLIPKESNNHKAKILHSPSLLVISFFILAFQLLINLTPKAFPNVLGYASQISPSEVIRLTNEKRTQAGLSPLEENSTLSQAALAKGADMLSKGYWAHFAPDGTSPWKFFTDFGYKYRFAGENLARDFASPASAVDAWMASPTHRDNILSGNYKEVGIGVVEGSLNGVDTTIIVQFFGARSTSVAAIPVARAQVAAAAKDEPASPKPTVLPTPASTATPTPVNEPVSTAMISPFSSTKNISLAVVGILLLVLSVDLIVVRKRRIFRVGGRTLAHIAYFGMILAVILILKAGDII